MVVEDQEEVRAVVRHVLQVEGYRVIEAPNGPMALTLLAETVGPVDLLLTDVVMPQMPRTVFAAVRPRSYTWRRLSVGNLMSRDRRPVAT